MPWCVAHSMQATAAARPSPPPVRAALLGALSSLPGGLAVGLTYYLRYAMDERMAEGWSWELWAIAVTLATPIIGACWAAGASWGVRWAARQRLEFLRIPALGGFIGGSLGGLVPMIICIGGFGALHVPYVGTALVGFSLLSSFFAYATLQRFDLEGDEGPTPNAVARGLASVLVLAPFGLAIMALISMAFPWETIVTVRDQLALQTDSASVLVAIGTVLSAPVFGGSLGMLLGLVTSLSRILARTSARFS